MKKIILASLVGFLSFGIMTSCSKDDEETYYGKEYGEEGYGDPEIGGKVITKSADSFSLTIRYEGETYQVPCALVNDSLVYLDETFNTLYKEEISMNPELAALTYKDEQGNDVIEYYHSDQELEEENNISYYYGENANSDITTFGFKPDNMPNPDAGRAILYDDNNYSDRNIEIDIDYNTQWVIANLKDYDNFNDKTSSIRVFNFLEPNKWYRPATLMPIEPIQGKDLRTCLIGYEDSNLSGKKLYCIATYNSNQNLNDPSTASHQDSDLKRIGWNDKISSVAFRIIKVNFFPPHE